MKKNEPLHSKKSPTGIILLLCVAVCLPFSPSYAQDDEDFIILDDRGEGFEAEEGDVPLSGRKPRPSNTLPNRSTESTAGAEKRDRENDVPAPPPPVRFEPTERVSEDLSVSFPADI
ncbi:MAG: hypothetical protein AB8B86_13065 [Pseudomonadales bacterium]